MKKLIDYTKKYIEKQFDHTAKLDLKAFEKFVLELKKIKIKNKKVILVGNGGSAAMASHVSVDLTKQRNKSCKFQ